MWAASLPDELWMRILESGVQTSTLNHRDLCSLSISCRRLHRLSLDHSLWSHLLSSHFPHSSSSSSSPSISTYRAWYERDKERKAAAQRRAVLRKESQVLEHLRKIRDIEMRLVQENQKLRSASTELGNLLKVRQASVALNVWQPEVIRGRQKQLVEQCVVPIESRIHLLEMEVKLCRHQISGLNKAYIEEKRRHEMAKEELASLKYHPLRDYHSEHSRDNDYGRN